MIDETHDRIKAIDAKIAARDGQPGFAENVKHLKAERARLLNPTSTATDQPVRGAE